MGLDEQSSAHGHGLPEPLALEYLAAVLQGSGVQCDIVDHLEARVRVGSNLGHISLLSCLTPNCDLVYERVSANRRHGIPSVIGGYHAIGAQKRFAEPGVVVVLGEGEAVIEAIVQQLADRSAAAEASLAGKRGHWANTRVVQSSRIENLDAIPLALRCERLISGYRLYDLMWPPASRQAGVALVLGSRGCAHACEFCASQAVWGRGVRLRSPTNVVYELAILRRRFGTNTIVFIDQSLGQRRRWTLELCEAIENERLGISWYHQSNLTVCRDVLRAMAAAGCTKIGFGLEGISPRAIERYKPNNPFDYAFINALFDYCNSLGLFVKVYLMIGSPWESVHDIEEYRRYIGQIRANEIKISYFTPFPGTRAWDRYKDHLVTCDWSHFDTVSMPVVFNPRISVAQYHAIRRELFQTFYGSLTYYEVTSGILRRFPHYVESYREFVDYLRAFDMITGREAWLELLGLNREVVGTTSGVTAGETIACS